MTGKTIVLSVILLAATASGQWLETTIRVGPRPSPVRNYDAVGKVYCCIQGGHHALYDSIVVVIDGASNRIVDTVTVGLHPRELCVNAKDNKVYCVCSDFAVAVIDGTADTVIGQFSTPAYSLTGPCYNTAENKVYFGDAGGSRFAFLTIVDGKTDSVVAILRQLFGSVLCCNPRYNKVYHTADNGVAVIDGPSNAVICTLAVRSGAMVYGQAGSRLYCASADSDVVVVIDGASDTVVTSVYTGRRTGSICYNTRDNKVYCANGADASATVVDGATNQVVATVPVGTEPRAFCYDSVFSKVYCMNYGSNDVSVIDCTTDSVVVTIGVGEGPVAICHNPRQHRVYVANYWDSTVSVIRTDPDTTAVEEGLANRPAQRQGLFARDVLDLIGRAPAELLDISGRRAVDLKPGLNDIRHVAPGVYFIHQPTADIRQLTAVRKVIVTK